MVSCPSAAKVGWGLVGRCRLWGRVQASVQPVQKLTVAHLSAAAAVQVVFQEWKAALARQSVPFLAVLEKCWARSLFSLPWGAAGLAADKACLESRLECRLN
jgi:hypothetical protein